MTYRDYITGDQVTLGVAPTGYRYSADANPSLPVSPEAVATAVAESMSFGASVAHVHGRDDDGEPAPERLSRFGDAVRDRCGDEVLLEYAVGPDCPTGDFLDALADSPRPDLATVRPRPTQAGYRSTTARSRRDTDRLVTELTDRGIKPNLLVTGGPELHELSRLQEESMLADPPVVTLRLGAPDGAVATPLSLVALLEAVPDGAHCFVRATGPNQYPLTTLAFFLGAHPMVGMEDNLFITPDQPVESNAQLVRSIAQIVGQSPREIADLEDARALLSLPAEIRGENDVEA